MQLKQAAIEVPEPFPLYDPSRILQDLYAGKYADSPYSAEVTSLLEVREVVRNTHASHAGRSVAPVEVWFTIGGTPVDCKIDAFVAQAVLSG